MYLDLIGEKYFILRESYWDKQDKKYRKRKFYLGELPILTDSLQKRIEQFFGKEIPKKIGDWFAGRVYEARENVLKHALALDAKGVKKAKISKRLAELIYQLNDFENDWLREKCGIAIEVSEFFQINKHGRVLLRKTFPHYMFLQDNKHCHYFFSLQNRHFCTKRISETSLKFTNVFGRELSVPYCDEHRVKDSVWWTKKERKQLMYNPKSLKGYFFKKRL